MRRVLVLCLMCLLPLQLLADGFNFPAHGHASAAAVDTTSSCPQSVVTDEADLPMASTDLSALTSPTFFCLRSIAATTSLPGYVPVVPRILFFPVPTPPPRQDRPRHLL
ncbi:hypothetical protein QN362_15415 [Actimicrobium sp. CCC2.4]|uniref:hypothetical protein n=1 Tax=Actimicrobium sp. CCC2.4 TaxID=3048606 RepID=UPI002AC90EDC|nr:hypothetical protein [Actimicrobium sp. CCC2.4]MEB0136725.1 hypothetical protein [Actimicrobium sp. CCC2.4]WPX33189.1 hypothetical protein RHM62_04920 [Actimicrobium sp. CCC2.4]